MVQTIDKMSPRELDLEIKKTSAYLDELYREQARRILSMRVKVDSARPLLQDGQ